MKAIDKSLFFKESVDSIFGKYFMYDLDIYGNLMFIDIFGDSVVHKVPVKNFISFSKNIASVIVRDTSIFSYIPERDKLIKITFNNDFLITEVDSIDLNDSYNRRRYTINTNFGQPFQLINGKFYFPLKSKNKNSRFIDDYCFLEVTYSNGKVSTNKKVPTPNEYTEQKRRSPISLLFPYASGQSVCFYHSIDRVTLLNAKMDTIKNVDFNPFAAYEEYDYSQHKDFGYIRYYEETNEANYEFLFNKGFTIIIKKAKSKSINEEVHYEYLVLDKNFHLARFDSIPHKINPYVSFSYKGGFVLMDQTLKYGYYYKINL
ncbi:MAG: hypothetical protein JWP88_1337 [Flaviaesturariibacter sp.]|nr:hypothetical protein [Flaviaesturariibacter sp.]